MRFLLVFIVTVSGISAISELSSGHMTSGLITLTIVSVSGALLWRNLRDPEVTRRNGERAQITFSLLPADGVRGTRATHFGTLNTYWHRHRWHVALIEGNKTGDVQVNDVSYRAWVWLDADGQPERLKTKTGMSWAMWTVVKSVQKDP